MDLPFTQADAQTLLTVFLPFLVPYIVSWLKRPDSTKLANLLVAIGVSVLAGALAAYAGGQLTDATSVVAAGALIFAQAQAHYATWFSSLKLDSTEPPVA